MYRMDIFAEAIPSTYFFSLTLLFFVVLDQLPTSPFYLMSALLSLPPFSILSSCSEEAHHLFPWKQQLIATSGHRCSLIITNRAKH